MANTFKKGQDVYDPNSGKNVGTAQFNPYTGKQLQTGESFKDSGVPAGWDPKTYANFKNANPTLEVTPEETAWMLSAPFNPPQGPIDASQFGQNSNVNIPGQIPTVNPNTVVAGLNDVPTIDVTKGGAYGQATGILNQQGQGITAAQRKILELSGTLNGKTAEEARLKGELGFSTKEEELNKLNQEALASRKRYAAEQNAVAGRPIGLERQGGKLDQLRRRQAIDVLTSSINIDVAQGDLDAAQKKVDDALKLEFEPIEQQLETQKMFLKFNEDNFNRAEKQQAKALDIKLDKEKSALDAYRQTKNTILKAALDAGNTDAVGKILSASSSSELSKIVAGMKSEQTGVPSEIAEKIGESKIGQKVNANIDFVNSLTSYRTLYKKYADAGNLVSVEAQKNLGALKNDLNQKYSVANGQGAVQTGDRDSYAKIIQGGVLFPSKVLGSMDTLLGSLNASTQNDLKFLDQTYGGYATSFFQPQLNQTQTTSDSSNLSGSNLFSAILNKTGQISSSIYSPSTGFIIPK